MTETQYKSDMESIEYEQKRLKQVAGWDHVQDLRIKVTEATIEFNAALKKYRDAYPRKE